MPPQRMALDAFEHHFLRRQELAVNLKRGGNVMWTIVLALMLVGATADVTFASDLEGTPATLLEENRLADREGFVRLNEAMLEAFKTHKLLVPLPNTLKIDRGLPEKYRWCFPHVRDFFVDFSVKHFRYFGRRFQITSAVRSIERHLWLMLTNGNAAPAEGPHASSHLRGTTIDVTKIGMSDQQIEWMRKELTALRREGFVIPTEESKLQKNFHIAVSMKYAEQRPGEMTSGPP